MYQRQFNYREAKQVILADIFNTLKGKGYNVGEPIRIPDEMEDEHISVRVYESALDVEYFLYMAIAEIQTSLDRLEIIGFSHDSDADCDFNDEELDIDSLSSILDFVEDMPEAKNATYDNEEETNNED